LDRELVDRGRPSAATATGSVARSFGVIPARVEFDDGLEAFEPPAESEDVVSDRLVPVGPALGVPPMDEFTVVRLFDALPAVPVADLPSLVPFVDGRAPVVLVVEAFVLVSGL